jgi:peroxiredoxin
MLTNNIKKTGFTLILLAIVLMSACQTENAKPTTGTYRVVMDSPGGELPFGLELKANADSLTYMAYALNGAERLPMDTATVSGDSLHIPMGIFEAELVAKIGDSTLTGYWKKRRKGTQYIRMNFVATLGENQSRFSVLKAVSASLSGKWQTTFFSKDGQDTTQAVGVFEQEVDKLRGTFLTPTGDYRYLEGNVSGDSLLLSCFDGSHVFLFKGKVDADKIIGGFWSSVNSYESWVAQRNANASLPDAHTLTTLKAGYETISFSFPDVSGQMVSLTDPKYKDKAVILQVMGTWCPNCMDETSYLSPWYKANKTRGVEIIGLAFEKSTVLEESAPRLTKLKKRFDIQYDLLLAGLNDKDSASAALPMLSKVMSFPTTIILDKKHKIRQIHTGFSGPGTGKYYDQWVQDFEALMQKILAE